MCTNARLPAAKRTPHPVRGGAGLDARQGIAAGSRRNGKERELPPTALVVAWFATTHRR
jgi:hypothetical protein